MFSNVLKGMIDRRGITPYRLHILIGVDHTLVYRWLNGERVPAARMLARLVGALNPSTTERADMFDAIVEHGERGQR